MKSSIFNQVFANQFLSNLLMIGFFIGGYYSYKNIRLSLYPDINYAWTSIRVDYPGAQPDIVEEEVTNLIEKSVGSIKNVDLTLSVSMDQVCMVYLRTNFGVKDDDKVFGEVSRQVNNINLPLRAQKPEVNKVATSSVPIIKIGLSTKLENSGDLFKERLLHASNQIETQLNKLPGIRKISFLGRYQEAVQIEVDPFKIKEYGLSMDYLSNVIQAMNFDYPSGDLKIGNVAFSLQLKGKFKSIEDVKKMNIPINNTTVRLNDIATISKIFIDPGEFATVNQKKGIVLNILKSDGVDSVKLIDQIKEALAKVEGQLPKDIEIELYADASVDISKLLGVLEDSSLLGLLLVFIILWLMIGFKPAIFAAMGIPISFCFCITILYFMDASLNQVTLFGFILVLGIVVDDAIVVIENIYSKLEMGLDSYEAVKQGISEVWKPILSATLTTLAAFSPVMFASGPLGKIMSFIAIVVCLTLIGSILECFFILPSHIISTTGKRIRGRSKERFELLEKVVLNISKLAVRNGGKILLATICLMILSVGGLVLSDKEMFSNEDLRGFRIGIKTPDGTNQAKTDEIVRKVSKLVNKKYEKKISFMACFAGIFEADAFGILTNRDSNYGQIYIELDEAEFVNMNEMISEIKKDLVAIPGITMSWFIKLGNAPVAQNDLAVVIRGDDFEVLEEMSKDLQHYFNSLTGIKNAYDNRNLGHHQIHININQRKSAFHGLTNKELGFNIYRAISGQDIGTVSNGRGRLLPLKLTFSKKENDNLSTLKNFNLKNIRGEFISLDEIATLEKEVGPNVISHYDQKKSITVTAAVDPALASLNEVRGDVEGYFAELESKYDGTTVQFIGAADDIEASFVQLLLCFLISSFLIYSILTIQFNSFAQPFLIILMIPVGLIGVSLSIFLSSNSLSLFIIIGIIGLSGVIVNDALMLISFFNNSVEKGKSISYVLLNGISRRHRPILMTTVTTVAGLMPTAFGLTGDSLVWQPLAQTFICGILFSTCGTLFLLPYCYLILFNSTRWLSEFKGVNVPLSKILLKNEFVIENEKDN